MSTYSCQFGKLTLKDNPLRGGSSYMSMMSTLQWPYFDKKDGLKTQGIRDEEEVTITFRIQKYQYGNHTLEDSSFSKPHQTTRY